MTMLTRPSTTTTGAAAGPETDLKTVVESRTREWHFHIYFLTQSPVETAAALALRDAVLRLRRDGEYLPTFMLERGKENRLVVDEFLFAD